MNMAQPSPSAHAPDSADSASGPRTGVNMVVLLSLLMGLQPVGTDFYLPALPGLVSGLGATLNQGQLTLTAMLLGFGVSQLFWGPLSDRFGRQPTLRLGLMVFASAALGSALAPSIDVLLLLRVLQGVGMSAVVVNARAIVRDVYSAEEGPRAMSKVMTGLGVAACISAPLGGTIAQWLGWRAVLLAVGITVSVALLVIWRHYRETLRSPNVQAVQPGPLLRNWATVLSHPKFWAFALQSIATFGGLYLFLLTSSFIITGLYGLPKWLYGLMMFSMSSFYILGTWLCRRLLVRVGMARTVALGGALSLLSGLLLTGFYALDVQSVWAIIAPVWIYAIAHGIHQSIGQAGAVTPFPTMAGTAAAWSGFFQMSSAFVAGLFIAPYLDQPVAVLSLGAGAWGVVLAVVSWVLIPRMAIERPQTVMRSAAPKA